MTTVGFVGLGTMGSRMAGRLLKAGHQVHGTDRTETKAAALVARGLLWCGTPREVAAAADVTFSSVTDDAAVEAITSGPDGILAGLGPGDVYIDMSTIAPRTSRQVADRVRAVGAEMLDAPVSGSAPAAADGTLVIMVGGKEATFRTAEPLLRVLGRTVTHIGPNGQALLLKLAINLNLGAQMLAFSEGVLLAERGGIDRKLAVEVMADTAIGSPMVQARAPFVLDLPDEAWFAVRLLAKDLGLALAAGRELEVPLPGATTTADLLSWAAALGYGQRDIAGLFEVLARTAKSEVTVSNARAG
ncbi:MAG TPA: NAD(P)-dependent oxidoreductase [Sporichthyaceae bacterium]|jgi:3-hydroxyisobutyrate dehydrogenase-like beta-hydroxyacid dehydrogenase|nr:NAD(P)-dependent oxidoreductase [Sporichthyaceae bacterium]